MLYLEGRGAVVDLKVPQPGLGSLFGYLLLRKKSTYYLPTKSRAPPNAEIITRSPKKKGRPFSATGRP